MSTKVSASAQFSIYKINIEDILFTFNDRLEIVTLP